MRAGLGELPAALRSRLETTYGITPYDSDVLVNQGQALVDYYVELAASVGRRQAGQQLDAAGRAADTQRAADRDREVSHPAETAGGIDRRSAQRST